MKEIVSGRLMAHAVRLEPGDDVVSCLLHAAHQCCGIGSGGVCADAFATDAVATDAATENVNVISSISANATSNVSSSNSFASLSSLSSSQSSSVVILSAVGSVRNLTIRLASAVAVDAVAEAEAEEKIKKFPSTSTTASASTTATNTTTNKSATNQVDDEGTRNKREVDIDTDDADFDIDTGASRGATPFTPIGQYRSWNNDECLEVTSLVGTFAVMPTVAKKHVHITVCDARGNAYGGHLVSGTVHTTLEIVLGTISGVAFSRAMDARTGYHELLCSSHPRFHPS